MMTDEDKIKEVTEAAGGIVMEVEEYHLVCDEYGDNDKFLLAVYDYATESGCTMEEAFRKLFDAVLDGIRDEVRCSDLSRSTKHRLLKRPVWEIRKALDSVRKVGSRNIADVPLRLINSKQSNQLFADDFIGKVVLSALCSLLERGVRKITFSDLWRVLHQSNRWNSEPDKKGFAEAVKGIVGRLDGLLQEFESEKRTLFCVDDDGITIIHKPALWKEAGKDILLIRREMLHVRCQLHWLQRIYIARRMELERRYHKSDWINLHTMQEDTGMGVYVEKVEGYMKKLVGCNMIKEYELKGGGLHFVNLKEQPSEPISEADHARLLPDGESGSESKQTPEETTI